MPGIVALDCEYVGVGNGKEHQVARVAIVNEKEVAIYDKYVKPVKEVVDYRTQFSGIKPTDLDNAPSFEQVQKEVKDKIKDKIVVGHSLYNDFTVLKISHPDHLVRDTWKYQPFKDALGTTNPKLKDLVKRFLNMTIQENEHHPIEDATAALRLYKLKQKEWEASIKG